MFTNIFFVEIICKITIGGWGLLSKSMVTPVNRAVDKSVLQKYTNIMYKQI